MKTVLIYDQCGETQIKFAVVDGDWSKFDHVYMNSMGSVATELLELIWPEGAEKEQINLVDEFPYQEVKDGAKVIVCGFLP